MLYDARTSPLGLGLTAQGWRRDARVTALARRRGFVMPPVTDVAEDATPARAVVNHGVLRAWCPDCIGSAEDTWRDAPVLFCMRCGNQSIGGRWRPVVLPPNLEELDALLMAFPIELRNWEPWGPPRDLTAEVVEWLAHAAITADPEHGLTDNEVAGEDDPEVWTPPFIAVTNAVIASVDCNAGYRGNLLWVRQFLSANPAAGNYWLQSSGTDSGGWVERGAAVLAAIGYTPVNRTSEDVTTFGGAAALAKLSQFLRVANGGAPVVDGPTTFGDWHAIQLRHPNVGLDYRWQLAINITETKEIYHRLVIGGVATGWYKIYHTGNLGTQEIILSDTVGLTLGGAPQPGRIYDATGALTVIRGHVSRVGIYNNGLTVAMADFNATQTTFPGALNAVSAALSGALNAASATITGAISAASAAISGAITSASLTASGTVQGATVNGTSVVSVAGTSVLARSIHTGTQLAASISDFTAAVTAVGNALYATIGHLHTGVYSAASHTHTYASATTVTYAGNGAGSRTVSLGVSWTPIFALIQVIGGGAPGMWFMANHDAFTISSGSPGSVGPSYTGGSFGVGSVTVPLSPATSLNGVGVTYRITAFGS